MSFVRRTLHQIHHFSQWGSCRKFMCATKHLEAAQRAILGDYLSQAHGTTVEKIFGLDPQWSYEQFKERMPVTEYENWAPLIDEQRQTGKKILSRDCIRYEPTSGSTSRRKWIPYTQRLTRELGDAASVWLWDLGKRQKGFLNGRHFWSLSWLPTELREEQGSNADTRVLPPWKQWVLNQVMATPSEVSLLQTSDSAVFATLVFLASCEDLSVISVWSPTMALELLHGLTLYRTEIAETLQRGEWLHPHSDVMGGLRPPAAHHAASVMKAWNGDLTAGFLSELWPRLTLVSAWDSSTSTVWAEELKKLFPHANFQGKGLWATEGVVTIPFQDGFVLAATSHFYEFRELGSEQIIPSWKLKKGMTVQPILTTGSGFFRYALQDQMEVTGFLNQAPCLKFLGRLGGTDLVGEKLDKVAVSQILKDLSQELKVQCVTLLACPKAAHDRPAYMVLAQGSPDLSAALSTRLEQQLCEFHHYSLARELMQLEPAGAIVVENALQFYEKISSKFIAAGSRKLEPITLVEYDQLGLTHV